MEQHTVTQLKSIAKQRGLRRYSKLRKPELIELINAVLIPGLTAPPQGVYQAITLDEPITVDTPTLTPTLARVPSPYKNIFRNVLRELKQKVRSKINSYADWLISYVPSRAKKTANEKLDSLKSTVSSLFSEVNKKSFKFEKPILQ